MIIPIWKPIGASTHQLAKKVGSKIAQQTNNPEEKKATHTGTLDPMAEGIIVVLTGEDRFKKGQLSNWKKTYEFEILFGVNTDSLDLLGLQTKKIAEPINTKEIKEELEKIIPTFCGKQTQTQPRFSAQRVSGKSGFDLAKNKQKFELQKNEIEIFSIHLLEEKQIEIPVLRSQIKERISKVSGDFRQKEVLENWKETLTNLEQQNITHLPIIKFMATVSKRTYIRSLVNDLSKKIGIPATTFSITRTKEGIYSKKDIVQNYQN